MQVVGPYVAVTEIVGVSVSLCRKLVGVAGFEPATPSSRTRCATRLRYTPKAGLIAAQYRPRKLPMRASGRLREASLTAQIVQQPHSVLGLLEPLGLFGEFVGADPAIVERD